MINVIIIAILIIWAGLALRSIRKKKRLTSCGCSGGDCANCHTARAKKHPDCENKTR